ncbi:MAG: family 10 glycosylhydrolase [Kiritimatiellales bacterium]|nr:family 10 glycosylhydrolase [Kiritimatiellales bacterium]
MKLPTYRVLLPLVLCLIVLLLLLATLCTRRPEREGVDVRAIWVTRFDYTTPQDVARIIGNVAAAGFTDVFFQIRGNATAFYASRLEPWAFELSGTNVAATGTDPGWDPLQLAIERAHAAGIRIHAYANVLPAWRGMKDPPAAAGQLWTAHREWFMVDQAGDRMKPTSGWYSFLNPVHPDVRQHLKGVFGELCDYDVDGIHLDYIRFPHDYHMVADEHYPGASHAEIKTHASFSHDPLTKELFAKKHGTQLSGKRFDEFRREAITKVLRDILYTVRAKRGESCLLTAAVMGDMHEGFRDACQDSRTWVRRQLIDWAVTMNYSATQFDGRLKAYKKEVGHSGLDSVVVGILCTHDADEIIREIRAVEQSGCHGYALFSYTHLFNKKHEPTDTGKVLLSELK